MSFAVVIVLCIISLASLGVAYYGLKAYFGVKQRELDLRHPANVGASQADLEDVLRKIKKIEDGNKKKFESLEKKIAPVVTMIGNRQIFRGGR